LWGKENYLYSFANESGEYDHRIEKRVMSRLDTQSTPVMVKLNRAVGSIVLSLHEADTLSSFVAFQAVRTPAFKRMLLQLDAEYLKKISPLSLEELRRQIRQDLGDIDDDKIVRLYTNVISGGRKIAFDTRYWLSRMRRVVELTYNELAAKSVNLLLSRDEVILTCDHPVVINYNLGLRDTEVIFPIGSHAVLIFDTKGHRKPFGHAPHINSRELRGSEARAINRKIMESADTFVFAAVRNEGIRRLFDKTKKPEQRLHL
jgi:hypothetical protein